MKPRLWIAVLLLAGCSGTRPAECEVEPVLFCTPFAELAAEMSAEDRQQLAALSKEDYIALHFGLGMYVRNTFGLWQDNALTRYFRAHGVDHPDGMSMSFIAGFIGYLRGERVNMLDAIKESGPPPPPPPPDS